MLVDKEVERLRYFTLVPEVFLDFSSSREALSRSSRMQRKI